MAGLLASRTDWNLDCFEVQWITDDEVVPVSGTARLAAACLASLARWRMVLMK